MRNIPFAFLNEETIDQINKADREYRAVNAFSNLAETQVSMRGLITWPLLPGLKNAVRRMVPLLEKLMEMDGPNSIANLERAMRPSNQSTSATE